MEEQRHCLLRLPHCMNRLSCITNVDVSESEIRNFLYINASCASPDAKGTKKGGKREGGGRKPTTTAKIGNKPRTKCR